MQSTLPDPQRQAAVDFARGSVRLEGFVLPPQAEEINRRYVAGEISLEQYLGEIKALARHV
jgi:hypothetical protein